MLKNDAIVTLAFLKEHGFRRIGHWKLDKKQDLELPGSFPKQPAIYLFAIKSKICYVGKSESVHGRFGQYKRGLLKGKLKVDYGIRCALKNLNIVTVYTLAVPKQKQFFKRNGLPVDYLSGLEAGLIKRLDPDWNGRRKISAKKIV